MNKVYKQSTYDSAACEKPNCEPDLFGCYHFAFIYASQTQVPPPAYRVRPAFPEDHEFLVELYATTRDDELDQPNKLDTQPLKSNVAQLPDGQIHQSNAPFPCTLDSLFRYRQCPCLATLSR